MPAVLRYISVLADFGKTLKINFLTITAKFLLFLSNKHIFVRQFKRMFLRPLPPSGEVAKSSVCEILTIGDLHNLITIIFRKYRYILL